MFKALSVETEEFVILLDPQWQEQLSELRALTAGNQLLCQECRQPVAVRAGTVRRWYFAHKQRRDCPYGQESPTLLSSRAVLYRRLQEVFGVRVTLEKRMEHFTLPRPVDCWVEANEDPIAYWILEGGIKSQEARVALQAEFREAKAAVIWIFTAEMLHEDAAAGAVHLTTTERDFLQRTYFDFDERQGNETPGGTLHYLDHQEETLTTFRLLQCIHKPQVYQGLRFHHPFSAIQISKRNGEFAHPGEREQRTVRKQEWDRQKQAALVRQQREEKLRQERQAIHETRQEKRGSISTIFPISRDVTSKPPLRPAHEERPVPCQFCGNLTTEWVGFDGATGFCRCRACYQKGIF